MPTYKNNSKHRRNVGSETVEPGHETQLLTYHNLKGLDGVEITSPFPYHSPIIFSDKIVEKRIINLPKFDFSGNFIEKFIIHFYIEKGEVEINFNLPENRIPLKLYEAAKWNIRLNQRLIDRIYIKADGDFICWLIIEKIP